MHINMDIAYLLHLFSTAVIVPPLWPFSVSGGLTVPCVLLLFVCFYIVGLVLFKKAGVISEQSQQVHYLPDNSPSDPYLYAVTIHTGLSSAAFMSAKVKLFILSRSVSHGLPSNKHSFAEHWQ